MKPKVKHFVHNDGSWLAAPQDAKFCRRLTWSRFMSGCTGGFKTASAAQCEVSTLTNCEYSSTIAALWSSSSASWLPKNEDPWCNLEPATEHVTINRTAAGAATEVAYFPDVMTAAGQFQARIPAQTFPRLGA
jgi:hypothetical protein